MKYRPATVCARAPAHVMVRPATRHARSRRESTITSAVAQFERRTCTRNWAPGMEAEYRSLTRSVPVWPTSSTKRRCVGPAGSRNDSLRPPASAGGAAQQALRVTFAAAGLSLCTPR